MLIRVFDTTLPGEKENTLICTLQPGKYLVYIDGRPRRHGGKFYFEMDVIIVLLALTKYIMTQNIMNP